MRGVRPESIGSGLNPMRLLVFISLTCTSVFAQPPDSLLNALSTAMHDTTRLQLLDAILESQSSDYALLEKYSVEMEKLSRTNAEAASGELKNVYLHYYATSLNNLAYIEENKSNNPGAIQSYEKALSIFRSIGDRAGEAMCLTNLGFISKKTGDLSGAIAYYEQSVEINKVINNQVGSFAAVNNLGLALFTLGDVKKALACYFEALKMAEDMGDQRRQARCFNNIAGVYEIQKEMKLQREYLEKGLKMAISAGEKRGEAAILINLVGSLITTKEYDQARIYADRVVEIATEFNDKTLMASARSNLASLSRVTRNFQDAVKYEKEALAIRESMNSKTEILGSQNALGEIYLAFNKYDEAITYFKQSVELSQAVGYTRGLSRASKNLSNAYKLQGNKTKALEYYELHIQMRDSITNEDNRKATFKSQYKYEYEIKATADSIRAQGEKTVLSAQLSQEKSQRYALMAAAILGVTLASFAFYRFRVKQEMKELQLRNRIASDLHDEVGSAISSISLFAGLAKMKSGKESEDIVAKIENTSRETVDNMSDIVWSIEPSNDRFDNVLRKMTYFGEQLMGSLGIKFNFAYENGIEKTTFDMAKRKNIYLIYKEAINNAAKYSNARNVNVILSKEGRQYVMEIKDDGKGFDTNSSSLGNGLRNMKRRTEEMNGTLTIESSAKGTLITLKV